MSAACTVPWQLMSLLRPKQRLQWSIPSVNTEAGGQRKREKEYARCNWALWLDRKDIYSVVVFDWQICSVGNISLWKCGNQAVFYRHIGNTSVHNCTSKLPHRHSFISPTIHPFHFPEVTLYILFPRISVSSAKLQSLLLILLLVVVAWLVFNWVRIYRLTIHIQLGRVA